MPKRAVPKKKEKEKLVGANVLCYTHIDAGKYTHTHTHIFTA